MTGIDYKMRCQLTKDWLGSEWMYTSLHQGTSVLQEYWVIPLVHPIRKSFEQVWTYMKWTHLNNGENHLKFPFWLFESPLTCCDCLTCVDNMLNGRTYSAKTKATEQIKSTTELFSSNKKWSLVWLLIWVAQSQMMLLRLDRSWWGQKIHPCNKLQITCTIEVKICTLPIIHFLYIPVIHFGVFVL